MYLEYSLWNVNVFWLSFVQSGVLPMPLLNSSKRYWQAWRSNLQHFPFLTKTACQCLALPLWLGAETNTSHVALPETSLVMASQSWSSWPWLRHHYQCAMVWPWWVIFLLIQNVTYPNMSQTNLCLNNFWILCLFFRV